MANARNKAVWDTHSVQLLNQIGTSPADHINTPQIAKWVRNLDCSTVLDFGCGVGVFSYLFHNLKYVGCDQNEEMIRTARSKWPDKYFILHDWSSLPFSDGTFDLAFTRAVIMHNSNEDKEELLPEFVRVIKPGGYYISSEATFTEEVWEKRFPGQPFDSNYTDGFTFTKDGWMSLFSEFGLTLVEYVAPKLYLYQKTK